MMIIKEMVNKIFKLPGISQLDLKETIIEKDIQSKAVNFDRLMLLMKEKLNDNSLRTIQKIQNLTMAPDWLKTCCPVFGFVRAHGS